MKFYFCETCGKRLTEHDIDGGVARDKKLKGVYCKECAVGVTTMESLPVSDEDARKLLKKTSGRQLPGAATGEKRASERMRAGRRTPSLRAGASADGPPHLWLGVAAGVLIVMGAAATLTFRAPGSAPKKSRSAKRSRSEPSTRQRSPAPKPRTVASAESPKPGPEPEQQPAASDVAPLVPDPEEKKAGPATPYANSAEPTSDPAESDSALGRKPASERETAEAKDKAESPAPSPPVPSEQPRADSEKKARNAWAALQSKVIDLSSKGELDQVKKALAEAEALPFMARFRGHFKVEREALGWLRSFDEWVQAGAKRTDPNQPFKIHSDTGILTVGAGSKDRIVKVQDDALVVEHREKQVSFTKRLPWAKIERRSKLAWVALALKDEPKRKRKLLYLRMVHTGGTGEDAEQSKERMLALIKDSERFLKETEPLSEPEKEFFEGRLKWVRERYAWTNSAAAWNLVTAFVARGKWAAAEEALKSWTARFKDTPFWNDHQKEISELVKRIENERYSQAVREARKKAKCLLHMDFDKEVMNYVSKTDPEIKAKVVSAEFTSEGRFGGGLQHSRTRPYDSLLTISLGKDAFKDGGTLEFWFKCENPKIYLGHFFKFVGASFGIGYGSSSKQFHHTKLTANTWMHMAAVLDDNGYELYLDGKMLGRFPAVEFRKTRMLCVGSPFVKRDKGSCAYEMRGIIDNIRIWNRPIRSFDLNKP